MILCGLLHKPSQRALRQDESGRWLQAMLLPLYQGNCGSTTDDRVSLKPIESNVILVFNICTKAKE